MRSAESLRSDTERGGTQLAEDCLAAIDITVSGNAVPFDPRLR
ncbi:hypothetical protein J2S92_004159 [Arthrobacter bambusae]|nr:hypothetical protein [Arthrobacter bambusae]MDQ0237751.1 hypothetical protein [Arthrobacter bambusae]